MKLLDDLRDAYEDWLWKYSPDNKERATKRLAFHREAIKNGTESPYTHPEKFDFFD